jgi:hypothetical protein
MRAEFESAADLAVPIKGGFGPGTSQASTGSSGSSRHTD